GCPSRFCGLLRSHRALPRPSGLDGPELNCAPCRWASISRESSLTGTPATPAVDTAHPSTYSERNVFLEGGRDGEHPRHRPGGGRGVVDRLPCPERHPLRQPRAARPRPGRGRPPRLPPQRSRTQPPHQPDADHRARHPGHRQPLLPGARARRPGRRGRGPLHDGRVQQRPECRQGARDRRRAVRPPRRRRRLQPRVGRPGRARRARRARPAGRPDRVAGRRPTLRRGDDRAARRLRAGAPPRRARPPPHRARRRSEWRRPTRQVHRVRRGARGRRPRGRRRAGRGGRLHPGRRRGRRGGAHGAAQPSHRDRRRQRPYGDRQPALASARRLRSAARRVGRGLRRHSPGVDRVAAAHDGRRAQVRDGARGRRLTAAAPERRRRRAPPRRLAPSVDRPWVNWPIRPIKKEHWKHMQDLSRKTTSRRRFLAVVGSTGVGAVLAACVGPGAVPTPTAALPPAVPTKPAAAATPAPAAAATAAPTTAPAVAATPAAGATTAAQGTPAAAKPAGAGAPGGTLKLMRGGGNDAFWSKVFDGFKAKTGITVETITNTGTVEDGTVPTALKSGAGPDVVLINSGPARIGFLAQAGLTKPLDDVYKQLNWTDRLVPFAVNRLKNQGKIFQGKIWEVPWSLDVIYWNYNKDLYGKVGIKAPDTYDEMIANFEKLKAAKIYPVTLGVRSSFAGGWLFGNLMQAMIGRDGVADVLFGEGKWDQPGLVQAAAT